MGRSASLVKPRMRRTDAEPCGVLLEEKQDSNFSSSAGVPGTPQLKHVKCVPTTMVCESPQGSPSKPWGQAPEQEVVSALGVGWTSGCCCETAPLT